MSLLSNDDLSWMRDTLELAMPGTCYILSGTNTSDGQGGFTTSWGTVGTSICRLDIRTDIKSANEAQAGGGYIPFLKTTLTLPHDATITTTNRVVYEGNTYNVVTVFDKRSWQAAIRCGLDKI